MGKKDTAPGTPGRVDAIGQQRTEGGQFAPKLPEPVDDEEMKAIVRRREDALERGLKFRPTKQEWETIKREALAMYANGHTPQVVAASLDLPESNVRRAIGQALSEGLEAVSAGEDREWAGVTLMDIANRAFDKGDMEEARKAVMDYLRSKNLLVQGPNTQVGVQVNVQPEKNISSEVKDWITKNEEADELE